MLLRSRREAASIARSRFILSVALGGLAVIGTVVAIKSRFPEYFQDTRRFFDLLESFTTTSNSERSPSEEQNMSALLTNAEEGENGDLALDAQKEEELFAQREEIYRTMTEKVRNPYGVPSLLKTFDGALVLLKLARSIDIRLRNNSKLDTFFNETLVIVQHDCVRFARQGFGDVKVLVIEGLAASGKSTLANRLRVITRGTAITAIPPELVEVRYLFTSAEVPEGIITALDLVINYCIAHQVIRDSMNQQPGYLYIIEQYYHAACARTVCANVPTEDDLQELPAAAFEWPIDLPAPHLVMFLTLSTAERMKRQHIGRGSSLTERSSERNVARDTRAQLAYSLVRGPPTIALDASVGPDDVLDTALEALQEFGVFVPPQSPVKGGNRRVSMGLYGAFTR